MHYLNSIRGSESLFRDDGYGYGKHITLQEWRDNSKVKTILVPYQQLNSLIEDHEQVAQAYRRAGATVPPIDELTYSFINTCSQEKYSLIVISHLEVVYGD